MFNINILMGNRNSAHVVQLDPFITCIYSIPHVHILHRWDISQSGNYSFDILAGWWFQPLWKIWKSVGIIIPKKYIYIYRKKNVPNHQPVRIVGVLSPHVPSKKKKPEPAGIVQGGQPSARLDALKIRHHWGHGGPQRCNVRLVYQGLWGLVWLIWYG